MNIRFIIIIFAVLFFGYSCTKTDTGLSDTEIIQGLKDALQVGTDTSVATVSKINGYFDDLTIKILLPPEADQIIEYQNNIPGLSLLVDSMVLKLNRAAEDAAAGAKPIFINAITSMTINDAADILHGSDTAATQYLRQTTYVSLKNLFQPEISASLDKPIIGVSANSMWNTITGTWNSYANSIAGIALGAIPVNITLPEYTTGKALYGLFLKVGIEEKNIRQNPSARIDDILKKVFGS